ncbi:hypothetical protein Ciccas_010344 [Cichlidogyrus casuarinus]|uniref:DUF4371 domain-containing protein n=1 Tax=Cichlidogyrus casuarinus TaxID=1844966 RepID=A0ABD2PV68_9PLAT
MKQIELGAHKTRLRIIFDVLRTASLLNLPLRGHRDHGPFQENETGKGVFQGILNLVVRQQKEEVKKIFVESPKNASYISP